MGSPMHSPGRANAKTWLRARRQPKRLPPASKTLIRVIRRSAPRQASLHSDQLSGYGACPIADKVNPLVSKHMSTEHPTSFGVFKPVGHVVVSFPTALQAREAHEALGQKLGLQGDDVRYFSDLEMLSQIDEDLKRASPIAAIGQELNLIRAHRELAKLGYHWLVVHASDDETARRVARCVKSHGAERAQQYGQFIIEELIQHSTDLPQVAESPDRGLNAQTPSGKEAERATLRPSPDQSHQD